MKFFCFVCVLFCVTLSASALAKNAAPAAKHAEICMISSLATHNELPSEVQCVLPENSVDTLLPTKAAMLRRSMAGAADMHYKYFIIVGVVYETHLAHEQESLFKVTLTFKVYDVAEDAVVKTWTRQGTAASGDDEALKQAIQKAKDLPLNSLK